MHRIVPNLAMASGEQILPDKTLLVFDEIQDSSEVLNALKYSNQLHKNALHGDQTAEGISFW